MPEDKNLEPEMKLLWPPLSLLFPSPNKALNPVLDPSTFLLTQKCGRLKHGLTLLYGPSLMCKALYRDI